MRLPVLAVIETIVILLFLGSQSTVAQTSPDIRAASVLFEQFETVGYTSDTHSDFLSGSDVQDARFAQAEYAMRLPFLELLGSLAVLVSDAPNHLTSSTNGIFVGAKNFIQPEGLGALHARVCYLAKTSEGASRLLVNDFHSATHEIYEGTDVWSWSIPPDEGYSDTTRFYAGVTNSSYVVLSNNQEDFQQVFSALQLTTIIRSPPLKEWEAFTNSDYWMYRSMLWHGRTSTYTYPMEAFSTNITNIIFVAQMNKRKSFLRITTTGDPKEVTPSILPDAVLPHLSPLSDRVWQTEVPLVPETGEPSFVDLIMFRFGFGVFV